MIDDDIENVLCEGLESILGRLREGVVGDVQRELVAEETDVFLAVSRCVMQDFDDDPSVSRHAMQSIAVLDERRTTKTLDHVASLSEEELEDLRETLLRIRDLADTCDLDVFRNALVKALAKQRAEEFRREMYAVRRKIRRHRDTET